MVDNALLETLFRKTVGDLAARRRFPESTYRLQFHADFTFRDAEALAPYLDDLGVTDCYASPYLKSRPGSKHGYDISEHRVLNPHIGAEKDYDAFVAALHRRGLGQVLDVVPNHMGITGNENAWWNDVLENGPASPCAGYFDIDWYSAKPDLHEKVLLPLLGDPYGKVLEAGQLRLGYQAGTFTVHYWDHRFPVDPGTYGRILVHAVHELEQQLGAESGHFIEYQSVLTAITHLPPRSATDPVSVAERRREKEVIKRRLAALEKACPAVGDQVRRIVALFNGRPGHPHSFDLLDNLLNHQAYRLSFWRVAADEINYRRFFDVNELAAISMEKPEVFEATHELVLRLLAEGKINGLRIDHPDGLYDPQQYLERLQESYFLEVARQIFAADTEFRGRDWEEFEEPLLARVRLTPPSGPDDLVHRPLYVLVEKILGKGEPVPAAWPVHGTTGYEFLNALNGLFVEADHATLFSRIYQRWANSEHTFHHLVYRKKFLILQVSLSSELHMLAHQLDRLSEKSRWSRDFTLNSLRHALRDIIAFFPVYRSYIRSHPIDQRDRYYVETAVNHAKQKNPAISASLFEFVRDMLLLRSPEGFTEVDRAEQRRFVGKFQQVTSPVMAKGVEDTAFYVYNRLLSLNEVGGDADQFGISVETFHRRNQERQARWPRSLSATSTHDTKRSEDVRARLNVLSEIPMEWQIALSRWNRLNRRLRIPWEGAWAPDRNDEYLLYQTLVGAWPLEPAPPGELAEFVERIQAYMQKALHEAKVHTSWVNPNAAYDDAVRQFVARLLDPETNGRFLADFRAFQARISHYGLFNSLAQTLLKIAAPGVPDIYQGTELWDFSLVDPDNRRPVDYARRQKLLAGLKAALGRTGDGGGEPRLALARELTEHKEDGRIKLYVTRQALRCRREHPGLFTAGEYLPVEAVGRRRDHVCAFLRCRGNEQTLIVVPRLLTALAPGGRPPLGPDVWQETGLLVPAPRPGRSWRNVFTGEELRPAGGNGQAPLPVAQVLAHFPVALLLAQY
jgi:(1->4)-alpha-D-glucan 1-alpha-D-glucosylmutase